MGSIFPVGSIWLCSDTRSDHCNKWCMIILTNRTDILVEYEDGAIVNLGKYGTFVPTHTRLKEGDNAHQVKYRIGDEYICRDYSDRHMDKAVVIKTKRTPTSLVLSLEHSDGTIVRSREEAFISEYISMEKYKQLGATRRKRSDKKD